MWNTVSQQGMTKIVPSEENKMRPEMHGAWPVAAFGSDEVVTGGAFFK